MFWKKNLVNLLYIILLFGISVPGLSQVMFTKHTIDNNLASAFSVYAKDVDGNGAIDILVGALGGKVVLYKNDGSGSFVRKVIDSNFGNVWNVYAMDVDRDAKIDILAASASGFIAWWKNNGANNFRKYIVDSNASSAEAVRAGDFDGDGDIDIVGVMWSETDPAKWYENNGNENFIKHILDANFDWAHFVCIADFNGDNKLDIAGAAAGARNIVLWKNNGGGIFSARTVDTNFSGAYCIESFDIDQDGHKDLLGAAHSANQIAWWKNNGSGAFSKRIITSNFTTTNSAYAGDIDGDGDIDVVGVAKGLSEVAWWENNGRETFTKHIIATNVAIPKTVILADLDNDGDLDVISQSRTNNQVIWWENGAAVETVSRPDQPTGSATGIVGQNFNYNTSGSTSSYGHNVEYQFDWGDGQQSSWGSLTNIHTYSNTGTFHVRARARCQIHTNIVSSWSTSLSVTISTNEYTVSGTASYYSNNQSVKDVTITITGDVSTIKITNTNGNYNFTVEAGKSIILTPSKPEDNDIGAIDITTYDAALTARYALGLGNLDNNQQIAADADRNGQVYTYDAALIAQYAVGLRPLTSSHVSEWLFIPKNRNIQNISYNKTKQNFTAIIIGNVHGGWMPPGIFKKIELIPLNYEKLSNFKYENEKITIPLFIEPEQEVFSADIEFVYDSEVLEFVEVTKTNLSQNFRVFQNNKQGRLRIGMYSVNPLNEGGMLLTLGFKRKQTGENTSSIHLKKFVLNNDVIMHATTEIVLNDEPSRATNYLLNQNYPNPFNSSTMISYQVGKSGYGSIKIFNLAGQAVRTLVEGIIEEGTHQVNWDGKNNHRKSVVGGVYIYQLRINDFQSVKKLLILE